MGFNRRRRKEGGWGIWGFAADIIIGSLILFWLFFPLQIGELLNFSFLAALYAVAGVFFLVFLLVTGAIILAASFIVSATLFLLVSLAAGRTKPDNGYSWLAGQVKAGEIKFAAASFAVAIVAALFFPAARVFLPGLLAVSGLAAAWLLHSAMRNGGEKQSLKT